MNKIIKSTLIITFFIFLFRCNGSSSKSENSSASSPMVVNTDAEKIALQHLYNKLEPKLHAVLKKDEILIGDTSIKMKVVAEHDEKKDDKWIYAANFSVTYQSTIIRIGSIGIGASREEAIEVSIQEWFAIFGIPFTNMLNSYEHLEFSDLEIFSGLMGIRGNLPENTWLTGDDEMAKKIISPIAQQIKNANSGLIAVDIKLMIGKNGISSGECRLDNQVSPNILDQLKKINWPSANEEFMFKQFYLIRKK